jgi:hypothetical protein
MKKPRYHHSFDRVTGVCRWKWNKWAGLHVDAQDWTIVGIGKRWFGPGEYEFILAFFGFEVRIWMKREWR